MQKSLNEFIYHLSFEITVKENDGFFLYMKKKTKA